MHIAIAGYSDLTHYIIEEFPKAGHTLLILTRSHKPSLSKSGIQQAITDYTIPSLLPHLSSCTILISTISDITPSYTSVHKNLLLACQSSPNCKRFIPAEFAANIESYPDEPGFYYTPHEPVREMLRGQNEVEWTLVCCGWLADYFVPRENRWIKDIGVLHPLNIIDQKIIIPGTGNEPIDFTWARDVVRALMALIDAPVGSWESYTFISGERSSWNQVLGLVERRCSNGRLQVEYRSLHMVVEMVKAAKDGDTLLWADYALLSISGACGIPVDKVRAQRERFFSGVAFRSVGDGLEELDGDSELVL